MKHITPLSRPLILLLAFTLLSGCSLFTTHYDATRHENFTKLQAFHIKFINDFTLGGSKPWQLASVRNVCDAGDLRFNEALVYAESKDHKDDTGAKAVTILKAQFEADCAFSEKRGKAFSKGWAGEHLEQLKLNYGYATSGELSRVGTAK